jgi:drug/metabolite transporter (DMT)-like permease
MRISYAEFFLLMAYSLLLSSGQILFKIAAAGINSLGNHESFVLRLIYQPAFWGACFIYGVTTVLWVWLLTRMPMSIAYPFVTFALIIVPLLSSRFFAESLSIQYWIGASLIIVGACIIVQS